MEYSLADLERISGAKRRSIQLWADAGVIEANPITDRAGTGTHRRFSRKEAIITCVIRAFASHQIAIGELIEISKNLRSFIKTGFGGQVVEDAIRGEGNWGLIYQSWRGDSLVTYFQEHPDLKHLRKPDGFAALILLDGYLSKIDE